tara:strand:+ start:584 stop:1054 length:471 start_codon:yes stop_codon:yes gene_type:complete
VSIELDINRCFEEVGMETIHGTVVELKNRAVLIMGNTGSGKSSLALRLLALGCNLVADDRVSAFVSEDRVLLRAPKGLPAGIEIRGVGIANVPLVSEASLALVVNLNKPESQRMPYLVDRKIDIKGISVPLFDFQDIKDPASAIYIMLKHGLANLN